MIDVVFVFILRFSFRNYLYCLLPNSGGQANKLSSYFAAIIAQKVILSTGNRCVQVFLDNSYILIYIFMFKVKGYWGKHKIIIGGK